MGIKFIPKGMRCIPMGIKFIPKGFDSLGNKIYSHGNKFYSQRVWNGDFVRNLGSGKDVGGWGVETTLET